MLKDPAGQMLNATQLAERLGVSKARVSQYVSRGMLDGCFTGEGRQRRFDLAKAATALGRRLDPGQMLGNGAQTREALKTIQSGKKATPQATPPRSPAQQMDRELKGSDPDRYEMARIQSAEEDARRKRRDNERDEGRWVLADEVERQVARMVGQEVAEFESVMRDGARRVADRMGVDFKTCRQLLVEVWREHREKRAEAMVETAVAAQSTEAERSADA